MDVCVGRQKQYLFRCVTRAYVCFHPDVKRLEHHSDLGPTLRTKYEELGANWLFLPHTLRHLKCFKSSSQCCYAISILPSKKRQYFALTSENFTYMCSCCIFIRRIMEQHKNHQDNFRLLNFGRYILPSFITSSEGQITRKK